MTEFLPLSGGHEQINVDLVRRFTQDAPNNRVTIYFDEKDFRNLEGIDAKLFLDAVNRRWQKTNRQVAA